MKLAAEIANTYGIASDILSKIKYAMIAAGIVVAPERVL